MESAIITLPHKVTSYEQTDFKAAYEKLFEENQRLQLRFQAALDEIDYLKKRVSHLEAENTYLRKQLFSQKSERKKKRKKQKAAYLIR